MTATLFVEGGGVFQKVYSIPLQELAVQIEYTGGGAQPLYIGEAPVGATTTTNSWRIRKFLYGNGINLPTTATVWSGGNADFDKVWDDRTTYPYS